MDIYINYRACVNGVYNVFLRIAVLENDIKLIRHYARYFTFDRGFIKQYYNQWKATFSADEWIGTILQYNSFLSKYYPAELLAIYLPAFELSGDKASTRNQYADLVRKMKKVIKDMPQFKADILGLAEKLKSKYPRRPAMVDELSTILT